MAEALEGSQGKCGGHLACLPLEMWRTRSMRVYSMEYLNGTVRINYLDGAGVAHKACRAAE